MTIRTWRDLAACEGIDPDLFFPDSWSQEATAPALEVCAGCLVRKQCLDEALTHNIQTGIWGGATEADRRAIRRRARRGTRPARTPR